LEYDGGRIITAPTRPSSTGLGNLHLKNGIDQAVTQPQNQSLLSTDGGTLARSITTTPRITTSLEDLCRLGMLTVISGRTIWRELPLDPDQGSRTNEKFAPAPTMKLTLARRNANASNRSS